MSNYSNIKNMEQLNREIRLLKRQSSNASKSFRKDVNNIFGLFNPARIITGFLRRLF
ncbi:MAG: hypothetical protein IJS02_01410 [Bacteroidales bacterium]|nr:hypothetical protein [Bacteroidales bacterium]